MSLADDVKEFALQAGADLVGIAPIGRFAGAPKKFDPKRLLPKTRSVISMAVRILEGITVPQDACVENYPYQFFGYGWLSNIRLNGLAFEIARFLEDRGHVTCPYPSFFRGKGASVSHRHVAVVAGLAKFGWHNLAITPRFGTRQRFVSVLTEAELESDPLIDEDLCDNCMACVDACPVDALSRDDAVTFDLAGQTVRMSTIDRARCVPSHAGEEGWLKRHLPPHVTFANGGHCGLCLLRCPKRGQRSAPSTELR